MANKLDFTGRRALVTGGGRGIGLGIVKRFVELGATVVVLEKDESLLENLSKTHPSVIGVKVDLCNWNACTQAVESVLPIHHLVNSAGIYPLQQFFDITEEYVDMLMNINFKVSVHVAQIVAKDMVKGKIADGTIVNIASAAALKSAGKGSGSCIYNCSKSAVLTLTRDLALEFQDDGIRVNAICPGGTNTETFRSLPASVQEELVLPLISKQLHNRMVDTAEVADGVVFLSSKMSGMVTGTALPIDGGWVLH